MLVRRTLPHIGPFAFEYRLPSSFSQGSSSSNLPAPYVRRNASSQNQDPAYNIDLENELPSVFQFPMEIEDIGGTLVVELGIQNSKVCNFDKMLMFRMVYVSSYKDIMTGYIHYISFRFIPIYLISFIPL